MKEVIHNVLMENLQGKEYAEECAEWSRTISDQIKSKLAGGLAYFHFYSCDYKYAFTISIFVSSVFTFFSLLFFQKWDMIDTSLLYRL